MAEARWEWDIGADRVTWSDDLFRLFGLEPRELRPSYDGFLQRVHPDDRKRVHLIIGQALRDGRPFDFQHRLLRPDGTVVRLYCRGEVERGPDGAPVRMFGISEDVSARD